jgi:hypothetical protein
VIDPVCWPRSEAGAIMQRYSAKQIADRRNQRPIKVFFKTILLKLICGVVVYSAKVASKDECCVISS